MQFLKIFLALNATILVGVGVAVAYTNAVDSRSLSKRAADIADDILAEEKSK